MFGDMLVTAKLMYTGMKMIDHRSVCCINSIYVRGLCWKLLYSNIIISLRHFGGALV